MKRTYYRIRFKVVSHAGSVGSGERVVEFPVREYLTILRREFSECASLYVELIDEWEEDDESASSTESIIILC